MRRRFGYLLLILYTIAPVLAVFMAGFISYLLDCNLNHAGGNRRCDCFGTDISSVLLTMSMMAWFAPLTLPTGLAALAILKILDAHKPKSTRRSQFDKQSIEEGIVYCLDLEREIEGLNYLDLDGRVLAVNTKELGDCSKRLGVSSLESFVFPRYKGIAEASNLDISSSMLKKEWCSASDGIRSIRAFLDDVRAHSDRYYHAGKLSAALDQFQDMLDRAKEEDVGFRLTVGTSP